MGIGLYVIGDEILSGRRQDQHFAKVRALLQERGLRLDWMMVLGDDRARLIEAFRHSFAQTDIVFSCGGIGVTPDDHTRQAAASALGVQCVIHPEAEQEIRASIQARWARDPTPEQLQLGAFPQGARIIPNSFNRIPGFSCGDHHFVPGFPEMAWPMIVWVLDTHYAQLQHQQPYTEASILLFNAVESEWVGFMEATQQRFGVSVFSLPCVGGEGRRRHIELGAKGSPDAVALAMQSMRDEAVKRNAEWAEQDE